MTRAKPLPDRGLIAECFHYDVDTGLLHWKRRPWIRSRVRAGDVAGTLHRSGYYQTAINGTVYMVHRLIWKLQTGVDPVEIDHINRVPSDNRWVNLREATSSQQKVNRETRNPHRGVHYIAPRKKYGAQIKLEGRHEWLGLFDTPEEACAVYRARAEKLHGEFQGPSRCGC